MRDLGKNRKRILLCVLMVAAIGLICPRYASSAKSKEPQFDLEKDRRFIICTGTGYAYISKKTSREAGRQKALAVAKRLLLRKSHQILQERLAHMRDAARFEFEAIRPGEYVRIIRQKEVSPPFQGRDSACGMQVTAEIRYWLIFSGDPRKLLSDSRLPLTVRVWSDKPAYREGEKAIYYIKGNRRFFTRIIDKAPDGEMLQLVPNTHRKFHSFEGGKTYPMPDPSRGENFNLEVGPPFGRETVLLFASNAPMGQARFAKYIGGFGLVKGSEGDVVREARAEVVPKLKDEAGAFSYVEFFETRWLIQISKR